jgi:putative DNA methylase
VKVQNQSEVRSRSLIESKEFPFEFISWLAERESWRKEIYRPIYHIHKWWAKRLGSVFRGILLGAVLPESEKLESAFLQLQEFPEISVLDPFMGSGTTIGEAHKLGMTVYGRDINPVICEAVRVALSPLDRNHLKSAFHQLSSSSGQRIREQYKAKDDEGRLCDVLYYFWVKQTKCPECNDSVDLFPAYVFARNAYPKKKPEIQVYCPYCKDIFLAFSYQDCVTCTHCKTTFNPHSGPAQGAEATCITCGNTFAIAQAIRSLAGPPSHRLYAKLILSPQGDKRYLPATETDRLAYSACEQLLEAEVADGTIRLPETTLEDGYNTRQAIGYNYTSWRDFFNARQLLALGWLHNSIMDLPESAERDALLLLFSGTLEFNNLFASYKGEGTGAVRHMFSHHVLKPERMPIEANVWGTPKSSGSFSGLFQSRLLRALDYRDAPFEIGLENGKKVFRASKPMGVRPLGDWEKLEPGGVAVSCGDSAHTGLPAKSIDLVVTDPPFFDNVHYSELADFFYAWQILRPRGVIYQNGTTTRHEGEVQDTNSTSFSLKLRRVFEESNRVLKEDGLLVFTYHHSRPDGWTALAKAVYGAKFSIVQAHPVRSELAAATPKAQAKEPILLDAIIVCCKQDQDQRVRSNAEVAVNMAVSVATDQIKRLVATGYKPTEADKFVIGAAQFFVALGSNITALSAVQAFNEQQDNLRHMLKNIDIQSQENNEPVELSTGEYHQLNLAL